MADIVKGLFGVDPTELVQQRNLQNQAMAKDLYGQDPLYGNAYRQIYSGAGGMLGAAAPMLGIKDAGMEQAQSREQLRQQMDLSTPQGAYAAATLAKDRGDMELATNLVQYARQAEVEQKKNALTEAQTVKALQEPTTKLTEGAGAGMLRDNIYNTQSGALIVEGKPYKDKTPTVNVNGGGGVGEPKMWKYFKEEKDDREAALANRGLTDNTKTQIKSFTGETQEAKDKLASLFGKSYSGQVTSLMNPSAQADLNSLKDKLATAGLSMTKTASGQSVGAISVAEWPKLEGMIGRLNNNLTEEAAKVLMDDIAAQLEKMQGIYEQNYHDTWSTIPQLYKPDLVGKKQPTTSDSALINKYLKK